MCMNQDTISPLGSLKLNIQIGHKRLDHHFLVFEKLPFPLFIGRDLIKKSDMVIHDRADQFWFPDKPDSKYSLKHFHGKFVFMLDPSKVNTLDNEMQRRVEQLLLKFPTVARKYGSIGRTSLKYRVDK